jgi:hypothetical protein
VNDQKFAIGHLLLQAQEAAFVAGFHQLVHQSRGRDEADGETLLAGSETEPQGDMNRPGIAGGWLI